MPLVHRLRSVEIPCLVFGNEKQQAQILIVDVLAAVAQLFGILPPFVTHSTVNKFSSSI